MSGARCPVQSSEERTATNYKWVGRGEEGCRMDSIKELRSCRKTGASTGELEHIASSPAEAEWSLPITWADAHRFPQPTCISFCWFLFFFLNMAGDETRGLPHARQVLCHWPTAQALSICISNLLWMKQMLQKRWVTLWEAQIRSTVVHMAACLVLVQVQEWRRTQTQSVSPGASAGPVGNCAFEKRL